MVLTILAVLHVMENVEIDKSAMKSYLLSYLMKPSKASEVVAVVTSDSEQTKERRVKFDWPKVRFAIRTQVNKP